MALDPRLEQDPCIRAFRRWQEQQRAEAEYKAARERNDMAGLRSAADRITTLEYQIMADVWRRVETYRD